MDRMTKIAALTGILIFTAGVAHAQGWYNSAIFGGLDPVNVPSPQNDSNSGLYVFAGDELYSGSVKAFSRDLGGGVSIGVFTGLYSPAGELPGFIHGFPGTISTNYASGLYLDPAVGMGSSISGHVSVNLGGGLSMNFLAGLSRAPGSGFYFGPGSALDSRMSTTVGTGFSMNFGHGGTLSLTGSVSRGIGGCGYLPISACR